MVEVFESHPSPPRPPKSKRLSFRLGVFILVLIAGIITASYFGRKKETPQAPSAQVGTVTAPGASTDNSSTQNSSNQSTSSDSTTTNTPPQPAAKTFSDQALGVSFEIGGDWTVARKTDEVILTTPQKDIYSVQVYNIGASDINGLKDFLSAQTNIHNITPTTINGYDGFSFNIDGIYQHGYAFLANKRLYYLLGAKIQNSVIALSIQVF